MDVAQCKEARQLQMRKARHARKLQVRQARQARQAEQLQTEQLQTEQEEQLQTEKAGKLLARRGAKILIIGGFKCATTTLKRTFRAWKSHKLYIPIADSVTTILFPFRDNAEVFPSAFFQNIISPHYNYSIFGNGKLFAPLDDPAMMKIVLETPVDVLFTFFKNNIHLFENAIHLNNITRIREFNHTYGCSIDYLNPEIQTFNIEVKGIPRKLIAFDQRILFSKFEELKTAVFSSPRPGIKLVDQNVGSTKWYGPKYVEFMKVFNEEMQKKSRADQIKDGSTYLLKKTRRT